MLRTRSGLFRLAMLASLLMVLAGCDEMLAERDASIRKSFQVAPGGRLTLDVNSGSIDVSSAATSQVNIEVIRKVKTSDPRQTEEILREHQVEFRQEGNDVLVRTTGGSSGFWNNLWKHLEVRYVISVPRKYNLDLKTSGGSIAVSDLEGEVVSRTSGGSLNFGHVQGTISGKTSGGSITVKECGGKVDVNTSGGSINLGKVSGPLNAHTSGGSVTIDEVMGDVKASTSGGSIRATISRQPTSDCELSTSGGSIHLDLNKDLNLNLVAKAGGGDVETDVPILVQGTISKSSLQGKMNSGGPELYVHSSGGGVHIRKLQ
ncbi:MAG TPA: DUF4097 family beta strand repeat-containing protein [Terriglobia bacterium]|nr:DUF4097 family beta strand repeat-containing protein [Terriglobia bacterium]